MNALRIAASRRTPSIFVARMPPSTDAALRVCWLILATPNYYSVVK